MREVFNISSGQAFTIREAAEQISAERTVPMGEPDEAVESERLDPSPLYMHAFPLGSSARPFA